MISFTSLTTIVALLSTLSAAMPGHDNTRMVKRSNVHRRGSLAATPLSTVSLLALASPLRNATALFFYENGKPGACGKTYGNDSLIVGIPTSFGNMTSFCGRNVSITDPATGKNIIATVGDNFPSKTNQYVTLTTGAFLALGGVLNDGELNITYYFVDGSVPADVSFAAINSTAPATPSNVGAAAVAAASASIQSYVATYSAPTPAATPSPTVDYAALAAASSSSQAAADAYAASTSADAAYAASTSADAVYAASTSAAAAAQLFGVIATATQALAPSPTPGKGQTYTGGIATYFYQNGVAGACGTVAAETDFVIAIDSAMYANGANCGRTIAITRSDNGHVGYGVVRDMCPTCDNDTSLDLSVGFFNSMASPSEGIFHMTWQFTD